MQLSDFTFTAEYKVPSNTIGVHTAFYYGSIDGVQVGSPCDSEKEALQELKALLHQKSPYTLIELLTDHVEWCKTTIEQVHEDRRPALEKQLALESALLEKITAYYASSPAIVVCHSGGIVGKAMLADFDTVDQAACSVIDSRINWAADALIDRTFDEHAEGDFHAHIKELAGLKANIKGNEIDFNTANEWALTSLGYAFSTQDQPRI